MEYEIFKFQFESPVHFGITNLWDSESLLNSDTLFSAMCVEAAGIGQECIDKLLLFAKERRITFSDALPYISDDLFLPKPYLHIERERSSNSSVLRKMYKNLKYIAEDDFDVFLTSSFDVKHAKNTDGHGKASLKISASVRNENEETLPYDVGTFSFNSNCGLYVIFGFSDIESEKMIQELLHCLSLSGLGGKRSSGYGRFLLIQEECPNWLADRIGETDSSTIMLLNTALPTNSELNEVLQGARYGLKKRSGFVSSLSYASTWKRKKDIFMFKSGSCFQHSFKGDIYDISTEEGTHPVYRYGIPMFMRLDV